MTFCKKVTGSKSKCQGDQIPLAGFMYRSSALVDEMQDLAIEDPLSWMSDFESLSHHALYHIVTYLIKCIDDWALSTKTQAVNLVI